MLGCNTTRFSESTPVNLTSIQTRASSQRALGGQQGHTHMLAKHIKYPKVVREDPDMITHAI